MPKFQVTVVQRREFKVVVEASGERGARRVAETLVRNARWDPCAILGDPPFAIEAIESVALSESNDDLAGRLVTSSSAPRPGLSSQTPGGALPEIARRYEKAVWGESASAVAEAMAKAAHLALKQECAGAPDAIVKHVFGAAVVVMVAQFDEKKLQRAIGVALGAMP